MNQTRNSQLFSPTQKGKMTTKLLLILSLAAIFLPQNIKGQEIESNVDQGNSLRGIANWSLCSLICLTNLINSFSNTFSLFQPDFNLKQKTIFTNNVDHVWFSFWKYGLENIYLYKTLQFLSILLSYKLCVTVKRLQFPIF